MVNDAPIRLGDWRPRNYGDSYRGAIPLRDAVAFSSNSVAVQLSERVGRDNVIRAARDLGITTPACGPRRACRSASTASRCSS